MDIKKLLRPNKIAVVGASEKEGFGGDTCRNIGVYMADDSYYFINPKRSEVFGRRCFPSISALPEQVDLVIICTPQSTVEGLLKEAAQKGAKAAVVYASGYGEVGTAAGKAAEESLKQLCETLDMALMGPNCGGFVNYVDNRHAFAFISEKRDRRGLVGVVSQSGQLALSMMDSPRMKFSYAISSGNSKICKMEDYLEFLVEDDDTKVIAMYLEGVKEPDRFIAILKKAAEIKKPIVVLKVGRSEKAQAIAASHTGSLAGADQIYDALFHKFGVIRVDDLEELMSTAQALATLKHLPRGANFSCMCLSGGETGICADLGQLIGIAYPDFSAETLQKLNEMLPSYATPNNPLDSTATLSYDSKKYAAVLETVMKDPGIDMVAVGYTLLEEIADPAIRYMSEALAMVCTESWAKPVAMIPFAENTRHRDYTEKLAAIGVPVLPTACYAFKVLKNIADFAQYRSQTRDLNVKAPALATSASGKGALSESASKKIIGSYGIPCGQFAIANSAEEAASIFTQLQKHAVVAKIDSPDILHKSDAGCVKLGIGNAAAAAAAYDEIVANAKRYMPAARVDGVQICEMVDSGVEIIIGVKNDPQFGPAILCGLGGVFVEIFKDTALRLAPVSLAEAKEMIASLKGAKMLEGYRGDCKRDTDALAQTIVKVAKLACDHKDKMQELDINPVFVYEKGVCAVDGLYIQK